MRYSSGDKIEKEDRNKTVRRLLYMFQQTFWKANIYVQEMIKPEFLDLTNQGNGFIDGFGGLKKYYFVNSALF